MTDNIYMFKILAVLIKENIMIGIRFLKAQPNTYILHYSKGNIVRRGTGISFFFFAPTTSLVAVPMASVDTPFIFNEVTADFQEVTVQGQVAYRVQDPEKLAEMLDFTLAPNLRDYVSEDSNHLPDRVINQVQVLTRGELQHLSIRDALRSSEAMVTKVRDALARNETVARLGLEILDFAILAVKPNPETARALEAEVREQMLRTADEAIYDRRNAAVEQERAIKENELNTEVAVENKKRQIREARIDADRAVQEKRQIMREQELAGKIKLEDKNRDLVTLAVQNRKEEADAQAYGIGAVMETFKEMDPKMTQVLASAGMNPGQLIALAFQNLAENANKIGNLNIAPELLQQLMSVQTTETT